jgi:hypothetical protein
MHENAIASSESDVEWVEVGADKGKHNLSGQSKNHECIIKALIDQGELAGLA